ncbi:hypothetical protein RRG08_063812 [Elysia crispata]|uniref:Uncharacterized protein n=1 Tax=Elysia crispata TaxID=231223 RepID=A0AAE1E0Z6_9GAST|nr:hypothetical protein RRG08_063812 [Elysia crispata]
MDGVERGSESEISELLESAGGRMEQRKAQSQRYRSCLNQQVDGWSRERLRVRDIGVVRISRYYVGSHGAKDYPSQITVLITARVSYYVSSHGAKDYPGQITALITARFTNNVGSHGANDYPGQITALITARVLCEQSWRKRLSWPDNCVNYCPGHVLCGQSWSKRLSPDSQITALICARVRYYVGSHGAKDYPGQITAVLCWQSWSKRLSWPDNRVNYCPGPVLCGQSWSKRLSPDSQITALICARVRYYVGSHGAKDYPGQITALITARVTNNVGSHGAKDYPGQITALITARVTYYVGSHGAKDYHPIAR